MKTFLHILSACFLVSFAAALHAADEPPPIDVARGKQLMQKFQAGETLTPEEQAYLDRVREEIRKRAGNRPGPSRQGGGPRPVAVSTNDWSALVPITDMTAPYKGEDGGLYGGGRNEPPEAHRAAYLKEAEQIVPRDANGVPAGGGKIGFITIGFSNPSIESAAFKRAADADPQKSPRVVIVNGCIGGRSAVMWAWDGADVLSKAEQERLDKEMDVVHMPKGVRRNSSLEKDTWPTLAKQIEAAGLSPKQVQVCWLKHVEANPKPLGEFPAHARALQADITAILQIARHHYPNLRVVYLSSRTFGGWSGRASGSPEPYAYESGFGTRWIVQSQIKGDAQLNFDPARGEVKAPLVLWGPYFWACGNSPRKLDGMVWSENDVRADRLHPNEAGCKKTTALLLDFFKTDEGARRWFLKPGVVVTPHASLSTPATPAAVTPSSGKEGVAATASSAPQGEGMTYTADTPIDPEHARAVMKKKHSGATLSAEEQAYLDRVQQMLKKQRAGKSGTGTQNGEPAAKEPTSVARDNEWQHLADGSYGNELDYTGVGGISLPGYVRKPEGNGPFPAVVFLHGGKSFPQGKASMLRQGQTTASPTEDFLKQGWVVYAIDYRPTENPVTSVLDPREIDDTVAAIKTIQKLAFVDPERIGILGGSHGAQLSTRLISRLNLKGTVICAPACFELPETQKSIAGGAKINALVPRIIAAAEQKYGAPCVEIVKAPAKYGYTSAFTEVAAVKCPVLFINGKNDDNSLYSVVNLYAEKLRAAGKQAETYFPDNGPHGFYAGHPDIPEYKESTRLSVEFFKKQFAQDQKVSGSNGNQITNPKTAPYTGPAIVYRYPPHDNWNTSRDAMMSFVDPIQEAPPGTIYKAFHSKTIDGDVSYLVALPPGYDKDQNARYPVLCYLGASGATPKREANGVQPHVDRAISSKAALPFIVIYCPGLCGNTMYCDSRDGKYPLETVITQDLIPHVDETYRTIPLREARGVEGFSMGGFGAAHLGLKFPDLFGVVSIKAPPLVEPDSKWHQVRQAWGNLFPTAMANDMDYFKANDPFNLAVQNAAKLRDHTYIRLTTHILTGENWIQARVEALHQQLLKNNIPHEYHVYESVKTHSPVGIFGCQGDIAFNFFNSLPPQLRKASSTSGH